MKTGDAPILLLGAGRMGGALLAGWRAAGACRAELMVRDPAPGPAGREAVAAGAVLNPSVRQIGEARTVVLAVKPQGWREAAAGCAAVAP